MHTLPESRALTIDDLRHLARRRIPRMVFDYVDGGAEGEITLRENSTAFDQVRFRPRNAVAFSQCDLSTRALGTDLALPFLLAPVGNARMIYPRAEAVAAKAAGEAGTAFVLSTLSGTRLEEVRAASQGPCWYQLYLAGGRDVALAGLSRVRNASYSALVVTIDTAVAGMRERDHRNGVKALLSKNPFVMAPYLGQILARPGWLVRYFADGGLMGFPNVILPEGPMPYADVTAALEKSAVTWEDLRWIREAWPGPLAVKGVMTAEDALRALDWGVDAMIVSNHGGRQLDSVSPHLIMHGMTDMGIPAMKAIQASTIWPAESIGIEKDYGSVEVGKVADFLIIEGDPLVDITATRNIKTVIKDGRVMDTTYDPKWVNPLPRPKTAMQP